MACGLINQYFMRPYYLSEGTFCTSDRDEGERSASRLGQFTPTPIGYKTAEHRAGLNADQNQKTSVPGGNRTKIHWSSRP
jgi:hypothetical protein